MASLKLNLYNGFVFSVNTNVEYSALTSDILHKAKTLSPVYRVMASGGTPPYLYSLTPLVDTKLPPEFSFTTKPGTAWYNSYADLYLNKSKIFSAAETRNIDIQISCKDSLGASIQVVGKISIQDGLLPYTIAGIPSGIIVLSSIPLNCINKKIPVPLVSREQRAKNITSIITITSTTSSKLNLIMVGKPAGSMLERRDPKVNTWTLRANFRTSMVDKLHVIKYWFIEIARTGAIYHQPNRIIVYTHGLKYKDY